MADETPDPQAPSLPYEWRDDEGQWLWVSPPRKRPTISIVDPEPEEDGTAAAMWLPTGAEGVRLARHILAVSGSTARVVVARDDLTRLDRAAGALIAATTGEDPEIATPADVEDDDVARAVARVVLSAVEGPRAQCGHVLPYTAPDGPRVCELGAPHSGDHRDAEGASWREDETQPQPDAAPLDLEEIRARAADATPGPWERDPRTPAVQGHSYAYQRGEYYRGVGSADFGDGDEAAADEAFFVRAREDVDALLAEVERLRGERDERLTLEESSRLARQVDEARDLALRYRAAWHSARRRAHQRGRECEEIHRQAMVNLQSADERALHLQQAQRERDQARGEVERLQRGLHAASDMGMDARDQAQATEPTAWDASVPPGGQVCAAEVPDAPDGRCGMPVETEPCPDHSPAAMHTRIAALERATDEQSRYEGELADRIAALERGQRREVAPGPHPAVGAVIADLLGRVGRLEATVRAIQADVDHKGQRNDEPYMPTALEILDGVKGQQQGGQQ